jgi:transposase
MKSIGKLPESARGGRRVNYPRVAAMFRSGRSITEVAKSLGCSESVIRRWMNSKKNRALGSSAQDVGELARLRHENARLRKERDLLLKAVAIFWESTSSLLPVVAASARGGISATSRLEDDVAVWLRGLA